MGNDRIQRRNLRGISVAKEIGEDLDTDGAMRCNRMEKNASNPLQIE